MFSEDEGDFTIGRGGGGGRSPSPEWGKKADRSDRGRGGRDDRDRGDRDRGDRGGEWKGGGADRFLGDDRERGGKGGGRSGRTTGREIPKLYSIHQGTVVRMQQYGAFIRLGAGDKYKDGLLHISRLSASGRVDAVEDVLSQDDSVWVKVIEVKDEEGKYSLDMRFVGQKDGEDQDPNNVQLDAGGKGGGKSKPEPIRIGAVQAVTCSRCGARGHAARECWSGSGGKQYDLVEEEPEPQAPPSKSKGPIKDALQRAREEAAGGMDYENLAPGHDPKVVKAALKAYFKRKAPGEESDSSSSSSSDKKKKKKKEKKKDKKEKKKEKKEKKKAKKEEKKKKA
eukprot:TRINITY_DN90941_c0_g1_i1.p1 TRINITY_DN90941_c0_g1~~TRINITY_DN90941_c0_g1_i1.p1  ORF type:complete len:359 (+),score=87.58 TRINITY_DN90941_c0_g1_i1:62-1078(+)